MNVYGFAHKYAHIKENYNSWKVETTLVNKVILALTFAVFTGLAAQVKMYLPFTPVPITAQVLVVLLSAIMLGKWAGISMSMYAGLGALGMPWFAGTSGGVEVIFGATGGYILGFVVAASLVGFAVEKYGAKAKELKTLVPLLTVGLGIIYLMGAVVLQYITGGTLTQVIAWGVMPFIIFDALKIAGVIGGDKLLTKLSTRSA